MDLYTVRPAGTGNHRTGDKLFDQRLYLLGRQSAGHNPLAVWNGAGGDQGPSTGEPGDSLLAGMLELEENFRSIAVDGIGQLLEGGDVFHIGDAQLVGHPDSL